MIVHDSADVFTTLIGRAAIAVGAQAGLGAALLVGLAVLVTHIITGARATRRNRPAARHNYKEAA
ncbi:hypothetical protein ACFW9D_05965 [Streptomyces sp. NPDC059524]|uniref:hypothetical protein n=1 Tax=Streptomyces sp. NPDC059524 TaxID=3346856 RepID=UPI003692A635